MSINIFLLTFVMQLHRNRMWNWFRDNRGFFFRKKKKNNFETMRSRWFFVRFVLPRLNTKFSTTHTILWGSVEIVQLNLGFRWKVDCSSSRREITQMFIRDRCVFHSRKIWNSAEVTHTRSDSRPQDALAVAPLRCVQKVSTYFHVLRAPDSTDSASYFIFMSEAECDSRRCVDNV